MGLRVDCATSQVANILWGADAGGALQPQVATGDGDFTYFLIAGVIVHAQASWQTDAEDPLRLCAFDNLAEGRSRRTVGGAVHAARH